MLLAVDVGNTLTDIGFFREDELFALYQSKTDPHRSVDEAEALLRLFLSSRSLPLEEIDQAIISSVVPQWEKNWAEIIKKVFNIEAKIVGPGLKSGIGIKCDNPKEVGSDLLCDCAGASALFGPSCVIVDCGTASKVIYLDETSSFAGCAIAPGIEMGLRALSQDTAALPEIALSTPKKVIGKNTRDCMNSALIYGNAHLLRGLAKDFEMEAGRPLKKILTGGYSSLLKEQLSGFEYVPNLVLIGLKQIMKRHVK